MTSTDDVTFAAEFPAADRDDWLDAVNRVLLKGRPDATAADALTEFTRRLVTPTDDGFDLQPLYTPADAPEPAPAPGRFPYTRGTHPAPRDWEIRQRVWPGIDRSDAVTELESGATGLLLELSGDADTALIERALTGVHLDLAPVSLATPPADDGVAAARALLDVWDRADVAPDARAGTLGIDPFGAWARTGGSTDLDTGLAGAADLFREGPSRAPSARFLVADGTVWHDAGAGDAQELAWTLAAAIATVRHLTDAGADTGVAVGSLEFRWAATDDQFATISKLRAARRLWARVVDVAGVDREAARMFQHADGSRAMLTRYDPWVNALRSTVACFAAAVGGADAVTVAPHDVLVEPGGSALGRRIARNTQSILLLESNLARVVDLAGGSHYVERRTAQLADAAWTELQLIEREGGLRTALESGTVHARLAGTVERRDRRLATRAQPLTGLTEFPDIAEQPPPPLAATVPVDDRTRFAPFELRRRAERFEVQRGRADAAERATGARPAVFLAVLGGAAATARVTFAKNLFQVAGIRTVQGPPEEYDATLTPLVCMCSTDAVYADVGGAVAGRLKAAGASRVLVAGRGLGIDGVDEEIGVGVDVLDVLTRALDGLGVPA